MSGHEDESGLYLGEAIPDERSGDDDGQADLPPVKGKDDLEGDETEKPASGEPTQPAEPGPHQAD